MAADPRDTSFWRCDVCNYCTDRRNNYNRHIKTTAHRNMLYFHDKSNRVEMQCELSAGNVCHSASLSSDQLIAINADGVNSDHCYPDQYEIEEHDYELENENYNNNIGAQEDNTDEWFPFSSKVEYYLYVLMHSTTHPVVVSTCNLAKVTTNYKRPVEFSEMINRLYNFVSKLGL